MIITFTVKLIFFKIKNAEGVGAGREGSADYSP